MNKKTLSPEQIKALMFKMNTSDKALFVSLLLCDAKARTWTWEDALSEGLWMPNAVYQALRDMAREKKLTIFPFNHAGFTSAHWINGVRLQRPVFTASLSKGAPFTTQEVTRRMKRYARLAGMAPEDLSLRTVVNTHRLMITVYGSADEAAEALGISISPTLANSTQPIGMGPGVRWSTALRKSASKRDGRLHGIGRRGFIKPA